MDMHTFTPSVRPASRSRHYSRLESSTTVQNLMPPIYDTLNATPLHAKGSKTPRNTRTNVLSSTSRPRSASKASSRGSGLPPAQAIVMPPTALPAPTTIPAPINCSRVSIVSRIRPVTVLDTANGREDCTCNRMHVIPSAQRVVLLPPLSTYQGTHISRIADSLIADAASVESAEAAVGIADELGSLPGARSFQFDTVFNETATQAEVFRSAIAPAVNDVLIGRNAVVMCYGPTGAGKTFTIFGPDVDVARVTAQDASLLGVLPRAMHELFERLELRADAFDFSVQVQYMQLYCDVWIDLLATDETQNNAKKPFSVGHHRSRAAHVPPPGSGVHSLGATVGSPAAVSVHTATNVREIMALLYAGAARKATAATKANDRSSRGHTIFHVHVTRKTAEGWDSGVFQSGRSLSPTGRNVLVHSTMTFFDLAGSERIATSGTQGHVTRLAETRFINTSLHSLGRVLTCLAKAAIVQDKKSKELQEYAWLAADGQSGNAAAVTAVAVQQADKKMPPHIPWRASKLTQFLQSCICPDKPQESSITLVLCASPVDSQANESLSTFVFGARTHAVAEALAGATQTASVLLRDSTYRTHYGHAHTPGVTVMHAGDGETPVDDSFVYHQASKAEPPAGGQSWHTYIHEAAVTSPSKSLTTREIDLVIDRQRTQIGALTQQYESLAAAHAELLQKYQELGQSRIATPAPSSRASFSVQYQQAPPTARVISSEYIRLEPVERPAEIPSVYMQKTPISHTQAGEEYAAGLVSTMGLSSAMLHQRQAVSVDPEERSPALDQAYPQSVLKSVLKEPLLRVNQAVEHTSARKIARLNDPAMNGGDAPAVAAVDRIQDAIERAKAVISKLGKPVSLGETRNLTRAIDFSETFHKTTPGVATVGNLDEHVNGEVTRNTPLKPSHTTSTTNETDKDDDIFITALSRTQTALHSALAAISDAYGGDDAVGSVAPLTSLLRRAEVMASPQDIADSAVLS